MRAALLPLVLSVASVGLLACGGADSGSDGPTCGGGFAEELGRRHDYDRGADCLDMGYFSGVRVRLPSVSVDRGWVLSGSMGDETFTCTVVGGMLEGEPCTDNRGVRWLPSFGDAPPGVELSVHPCRVSLRLDVDGERVASATFEPEYEWSEPNGVGCGWIGEATVVLSPDEP